MRKFVFLIVLMAMMGSGLRAQQLPLYSQYYFNPILYNPASAGSSERFEMSLIYRNQWTGLEGAPKTAMFTFGGPLNMGSNISSQIYSDKAGAFSRLGADLGYAYRLELAKDIFWSLGLTAQFVNISLNGELLTFQDQNEQVIPRVKEKRTYFDATASTFFNGKYFYAGFSVPQILGGQVKLGGEGNLDGTWVHRHFFALGGVFIPTGEKSILEPNLLFKATQGAPLQLDAGLRLELSKRYWIGVTYRTRAALSLSLGLLMMDKVVLAYSYDYSTIDLGNAYPSSHEIMLKYLFPKKQISYASF